MQMAPISIGILNEPVGNMSPMTFLWALIGMNPGYEIICGAAEVIGGVLILFRRTALVGALLSAFVMANVLLYNMFFDVPVKLFAGNLLLALLFITLPDVQPLFRFFWLHQPAAPVGVWVPPASRRQFRIATRVVELIFVATFLIWMPIGNYIGLRGYWKELRVPNALLGAWKVDTAHTSGLESPEHEAITDLYVDDSVRAFSRSTGGALWRTNMKPDPAKHTMRIGIYVNDPVLYALQMPDNDHAVLTAIPPEDKKSDAAKKFKPSTVVLTRVPVPAHYPLLDRGFHWVNEWVLSADRGLASAKLVEVAAIALGWTPGRSLLKPRHALARLVFLLASGDACLGFAIQRLRHSRRTSHIAQRQHIHNEGAAVVCYRYCITNFYVTRRLRLLLAQLHAAKIARLHCERTRLEETRSPQPLI